jgi:hypothetical protein
MFYKIKEAIPDPRNGFSLHDHLTYSLLFS